MNRLKYVLGVVAVLFVVGWLLPSADEPTAPSAQSGQSARPAAPATLAPTVAASPSLGTPETRKRSAALAALAALAVKGRAPMTGYDRMRFGQAWLDADRNGCDTRNDVLADHLKSRVMDGCVVLSGRYLDPYTGSDIDFRRGPGDLIDIDHVVSLGNAWVTGASKWDIKKRAALANDPLNLLPADASANRQKGDGDAATWLPPNRRFRCSYVARQVAVKKKYGLWVTPPEKGAIERLLSGCPDQQLPRDRWHAPTRVDHNITDVGAPDRKETGRSGPKTLMGSTYYENCTAVRAAAADPIHRGDPGYGRHLDRDGDGVGCE